MEQTAKPDTIQITEHTYKLVAGYVRCEELSHLDNQGKADKVRAYRVTVERGTRSRIDVERKRGFARFTGRERELELLHDTFVRTSEGRGQVMPIIGEVDLGSACCLNSATPWLAPS